MTPFNPSFLSFNLPSGNVTQSFAPFFSQQVGVTYQGSLGIEERVVTEVASFGKQLGRILDAVVALSEGRPDKTFEDLRTMRTQIEAVKTLSRANAEQAATEALNALARADPKGLDAFLARYRRPAETAK